MSAAAQIALARQAAGRPLPPDRDRVLAQAVHEAKLHGVDLAFGLSQDEYAEHGIAWGYCPLDAVGAAFVHTVHGTVTKHGHFIPAKVLPEPPPALAIDLRIERIGNPDATTARISPIGFLDRLTAWNLMRHLEAAGWIAHSVNDGEETTRLTSGERAREAMELMFSVDEAWVHFSNGKAKHYVYFVMGNDGWDIASDYSYAEGDADGFNAVMEAFDAEWICSTENIVRVFSEELNALKAMTSTETPGDAAWRLAISERDAARAAHEETAVELRTIREQRDAALAAIRGLFEQCSMMHKRWGEGANLKESDAAIATALALVSP